MSVVERARALTELLAQERAAIARFDLVRLEQITEMKAAALAELIRITHENGRTPEDVRAVRAVAAQAEANRSLIAAVIGAFEASLGIEAQPTYDGRARLKSSSQAIAGTTA